jgi:hypothetical protein
VCAKEELMKNLTIDTLGPTRAIDEAIERLIKEPGTRIKKVEFFGTGPYDNEVTIHCTTNNRFAEAIAKDIHILSPFILGNVEEH